MTYTYFVLGFLAFLILAMFLVVEGL